MLANENYPAFIVFTLSLPQPQQLSATTNLNRVNYLFGRRTRLGNTLLMLELLAKPPYPDSQLGQPHKSPCRSTDIKMNKIKH